jgi:hypothetical protein
VQTEATAECAVVEKSQLEEERPKQQPSVAQKPKRNKDRKTPMPSFARKPSAAAAKDVCKEGAYLCWRVVQSENAKPRGELYSKFAASKPGPEALFYCRLGCEIPAEAFQQPENTSEEQGGGADTEDTGSTTASTEASPVRGSKFAHERVIGTSCGDKTKFYVALAEWAKLMITEYQATDMMLLKHVTNKDAQVVLLHDASTESDGDAPSAADDLRVSRVNQVAMLAKLPEAGKIRGLCVISYYESKLDHASMGLEDFIAVGKEVGSGMAL